MSAKGLLKSSFAAMMAAILAIGMMTSCSRQSSEMLENIPADSKVIVKYNFKQMLENLDCKLTDGKIVLSDDLNKVVKESGVSVLVNQFLGYTEGVNLDEIYMVARGDDDDFFLMSLYDKKKVIENLEGMFGDSKSIDGYDVFEINGFMLALDGDYLWVVDDVDDIKSAKKAASKNHVGTMPGILDFVSSDNTVNFAASLADLDLGADLNDKWACASLKFDGQVASSELCVMGVDGNRAKLGEAFGEISTDFLRYVPQNMNLVAAVGKVEEPALKKQIESYVSVLPEDLRMFGDFDGTVALAANFDKLTARILRSGRVPSDEEVLSLLDYVLMVHYPQSVVNNLVGIINASIGGQEVSQGIYKFSIPGLEGYYGSVDGYLDISTTKPDGKAQNEFNEKFAGHRAAIYSYVQPNDTLRSIGIDYASECSIWLDSDVLKGESKIIGTDAKYLQSIVSLLINPKFQKTLGPIIQDAINGRRSYGYGGYDYDYGYDYDEPLYY